MADRRVSVFQIATISAAGHALIGVLCMWLAFALLMLSEMPPQTAIADAFTGLRETGFGALLLFPVAFAAIGFTSGMVACHIRNLYIKHCCPDALLSQEPQMVNSPVKAQRKAA